MNLEPRDWEPLRHTDPETRSHRSWSLRSYCKRACRWRKKGVSVFNLFYKSVYAAAGHTHTVWSDRSDRRRASVWALLLSWCGWNDTPCTSVSWVRSPNTSHPAGRIHPSALTSSPSSSPSVLTAECHLNTHTHTHMVYSHIKAHLHHSMQVFKSPIMLKVLTMTWSIRMHIQLLTDSVLLHGNHQKGLINVQVLLNKCEQSGSLRQLPSRCFSASSNNTAILPITPVNMKQNS